MQNSNIYSLSNSDSQVHFEKNIQITDLGKLFNTKISKELNLNIVTSYLSINKQWISIDIKQRGIEGGMFGIISTHTEENVLNMTNGVCIKVWDALSEAINFLTLPKLDYYNNLHPYKLKVSLFDFVKRSRFGYFMDNAKLLDDDLKRKFDGISLSLRVNDDIRYYYLIFGTEEDMKKADELFGIENINNYIWERCKKEDTYNVFEKPLPSPIVTTKQKIIDSGKAMGIMRNNLQFTTLI